LMLLILAALVATVSVACGGPGSGGSSQASEKQQASRTALRSKGLKTRDLLARLRDDSGTLRSGRRMRPLF
jgi:hypothetical protein